MKPSIFNKIIALFLRMFGHTLYINTKAIIKGAKLSSEETRQEIESWGKENNINYKIEEGFIIDASKKVFHNVSLWRKEKNKFIIHIDSLRASHTTLKSLRGTLDKIK